MVGLRKVNFFEIALLIVGLSIGIVGFRVIYLLYEQGHGDLSWDLFTTVFLWLILIVLLILAATMEDVKEELAIVIKELIEETRILKQINNEILQETKIQLEETRIRNKIEDQQNKIEAELLADSKERNKIEDLQNKLQEDLLKEIRELRALQMGKAKKPKA